ncbi:MAG: M12 family metallopeptidase [Parvibaculaceae bacterium]
MTAFSVSKWVLASVIAMAAAGGAMAGENLLLARDKLPVKYVKRIKEYQKALDKLDDSDQAKGIYRNSSLWGPNYPKLRVCFFEGSQALREVVANVAKEWMADNNSVKLDFGKSGKRRTCQPGNGREMQIRVSFSQEGYWSQVGQNSVVFAKQDEASLNLGGFMNVTPDQLSDYEIGTIRHEFGHALGIEHEHQNPKGGCDNEYNWQQIYQYLEGPPNNWTKETIDWNLRQAAGEDLQLTKFDKNSVMLYQFPADFYKRGAKSKCFVAQPNSQISSGDRALVAAMYPANPSARLEAFQKNKEKFEAIWKKDKDGTKGVMFDAVKAFFGRDGTKDAPAEED